VHTFDDLAATLSPRARSIGSALRDTCPSCEGRQTLSLTKNADGSPKLVCHRCRTRMGDLIKALGVPKQGKPLQVKPLKTDASRIGEAMVIWRSSTPIGGTAAEAYLRSRGITWPLPGTLRFHMGLSSVEAPFKSYPALVAAMTSVSRELRAVYVIYLDGAAKAPLEHAKIFRGCPAGASVHLAALRGDSLIICEGVETGLSILQLACEPEPIPVWACGSTAELVNFEVPAVRTLYIGIDIDVPRRGQQGDGEIAARRLIERLSATRPEIEVFIQWPEAARLGVKGDFNDELRDS
jgi:Toprim domain